VLFFLVEFCEMIVDNACNEQNQTFQVVSSFQLVGFWALSVIYHISVIYLSYNVPMLKTFRKGLLLFKPPEKKHKHCHFYSESYIMFRLQYGHHRVSQYTILWETEVR
jgi:hypothetical protein